MSFIAELKRRNVIRVGILYAVASWLILQVADVLFGLMGLPDWSLRLVLAILVLGFPIALIYIIKLLKAYADSEDVDEMLALITVESLEEG